MEHNRNYGSPRIWDQLHHKDGIKCSRNRVAGLMREDGIVAVHKRRFRVTTDSNHDSVVWPNVLKRNFIVEKPNTAWVSDITYIWTMEGGLYLATVLDLFSRGIVGLAMDKTIEETLVLKAMQQAIVQRNPQKGLIFHSDRGSQYAIKF